MIRKAIIVLLTLGAVGVAVLGVATYFEPYVWEASAEPGPKVLLPEPPRAVTVHSGTIEYRHLRFSKVAPPTLVQGPFWHEGPNWQAGGFAFSSGLYLRILGIKDALGNQLPGEDVLSTVPAEYILRHGESSAIVALQNLRVQAPLWFLVLRFAAYPALAFIRGPLRRWRRRRKGLCAKCGYNLTGLTAPRCPECGTEIKQS